MNFIAIARLFSRRDTDNVVTAIERKRLADTMPGQTGAVAAFRLGHTLG